jgi:hypothetical protein
MDDYVQVYSMGNYGFHFKFCSLGHLLLSTFPHLIQIYTSGIMVLLSISDVPVEMR